LENSRPKPGRMEETLEGGRGPPRAVAPLETESLKKYSNIKFHENPSVGAELFHRYGQTQTWESKQSLFDILRRYPKMKEFEELGFLLEFPPHSSSVRGFTLRTLTLLLHLWFLFLQAPFTSVNK